MMRRGEEERGLMTWKKRKRKGSREEVQYAPKKPSRARSVSHLTAQVKRL